MKKLIFAMSGIFVLMGMVFTADGIAQEAPPEIKVTLALDKSVYGPDDPIHLIMTLANEGNVDVITSKGFSDREFYLLLRFIDEKGKVITSYKLDDATVNTPPPPKVFPAATGILLQGELVEFLAAKNAVDGGWVKSFGSFTDPENYLNVYDYYPLKDRIGHFTVKAVIPMRSYMDYALTNSGVQYAPLDTAGWYGTLESNILSLALVVDADGDGYYYPEPYGAHSEADCDDTNALVHPGAVEKPNNGIDDDCNPATPDVAVVNPGTIIIEAVKRTVGPGSTPETRRMTIPGLEIRVYDTSAGSCAAGIGVSKQHYKSIWYTCIPPNGAGVTDGSGIASIETAAGDYLVIGEYDPDGNADNGDEIYPTARIRGLEPDETIQEKLIVMEKADKKTLPALYTKLVGSELLIIQPEYVEWEGTQELYPFVFESVGDWSVTTAINPPEGFTADQTSLSERVNTEAKAMQFTITDVGSRWISTGVIHTVKHKKKTQNIQSKIGVKLTPELAQEKGVSIWGEDDQGEDNDDQGQNGDDQGKGKKK